MRPAAPFAGICLLAVSALASAQGRAFQLDSGVVVDPARGAVFLMNPKGGIDAVDLASGEPRWVSSAAAKPLAVAGNRLIAQVEDARAAHELPLAALDLRSGSAGPRMSLPLPADTWPAIDQGLGSQFDVEARGDGPGVVVSWTATSREISGIARPAPNPETKRTGAARVDFAARRVAALSPAEAAARPRADAAPGKPPKTSASDAFMMPVTRARDRFVALAWENPEDPARRRLLLRRWRAQDASPLADVDLRADINNGFGYGLSADGAAFAAAKGAGQNLFGRLVYVWSLYNLDDGRLLGEVKLPGSVAPFFVWRSLLVYCDGQSPASVRAVDLSSGTGSWSRPLRDTSYRGSYPP